MPVMTEFVLLIRRVLFATAVCAGLLWLPPTAGAVAASPSDGRRAFVEIRTSSIDTTAVAPGRSLPHIDRLAWNRSRSLHRDHSKSDTGHRNYAQNTGRPKDHDRARDAVRRGQALPLAQIIRSLQATCPGTFLNAKLERRGDMLAYRVQLLRPSGRRVTMIVDAQSGRVVGGSCR